MKKLGTALTFLFLFTLSACTAFNVDVMRSISKYRERVAKEIMVIEQPIFNGRPEFFNVDMLADSARKMNAPNGDEFLQLLDKRITGWEQQNGRKICLHGYNVNSRKPDIRDHSWGDYAGFWMLTIDCNL